jgi:hypothetical protein
MMPHERNKFGRVVMAVCIGCVRAVTFGDAPAIVWLDVSPTV